MGKINKTANKQLGVVRDLNLLHKISEDATSAEAKKLDFLLRTKVRIIQSKGRSPAGLAAIQIGENKKVCIVESSKKKFMTLVNPNVLQISEDTETCREKCLSFDSPYMVERPTWAVIEYYDLNMNRYEEKFEGTLARRVLHEIDHMYGKTIADIGELITE